MCPVTMISYVHIYVIDEREPQTMNSFAFGVYVHCNILRCTVAVVCVIISLSIDNIDGACHVVGVFLTFSLM